MSRRRRDHVARTHDGQIERDGPTKSPNPMVSSHDAYLVAAITSEAAATPPEAPQAAAASGTRGACQAAAGPAVIGGLRRPPLLRAPCARTAGPWAVRERRRFTAEPVGARANPGHGTPAASDLELGRTAALPDTRRLPQSPERVS